MPDTTEKDAPKEGLDAKASGEVDTSQDLGQKEVQEKMDAIEEKGYIGQTADPTPRENYASINSSKENDLPTPETDEELYREARERTHGVFPKNSVDQTTVETHEAKKSSRSKTTAGKESK